MIHSFCLNRWCVKVSCSSSLQARSGILLKLIFLDMFASPHKIRKMATVQEIK